MASPSSLPSIPIISITFQLLFLTGSLSQGPISSSSPSPPTMATCGARLLPLVVCGPFVQGLAQSPAPPCCDSLKQLYSQQPGCLCLLLNTTTASVFPMNSTLALELPQLCNLQVDTTTCPGSSLPPIPSNSSASFGPNASSTAAASPVVQVAPRQGILGYGLGRSISTSSKRAGQTIMLVAATAAYVLI